MLRSIRWFCRNFRDIFRRPRDRQHRNAALATLFVKKIVRKPIVFPDRNGFQYIILPEEDIYSLYHNGYLGYPEIAEQEFCKKVLRPGMTVFDIGAHIGQFTLLFASLVGPSGRVFAFEPCDSTMRRLKAHILLNGFNNVITEKVAVYSINSSHVKLNIFPQRYSFWNTIGKPKMFSRDHPNQIEPVDQEVVRTVTINEYCRSRRIQALDYLKVDVEGAELDVLKSCSGLLKRGAIRYIQFEVSQAMVKGMGRDGTEVFKLLKDFGYECHPISVSGELQPPVTRNDAFFANFIAMPKGK